MQLFSSTYLSNLSLKKYQKNIAPKESINTSLGFPSLVGTNVWWNSSDSPYKIEITNATFVPYDFLYKAIFQSKNNIPYSTKWIVLKMKKLNT